MIQISNEEISDKEASPFPLDDLYITLANLPYFAKYYLFFSLFDFLCVKTVIYIFQI